MEELKKCPFCGKPGICEPWDTLSPPKNWAVRCDNYHSTRWQQKEDAIKDWNTRTKTD